MNIGRMRHIIQLQSLVPVQDAGSGAITPTWTNFGPGEIAAIIDPVTAAEFIAGGGSNSKITTKLTIRYMDGVLASMRALNGSRVYQVDGVLPDKKSGFEYLVLLCSEVVNG